MSTGAATAIKVIPAPTAGGPRTQEGKAISSQNAITHGFTAKSPVLPSEDPAEFEAFRDLQLTTWSPDTPAFRNLVLEFADISWRLNRAGSHEAKLIAIELKRMQIERKDNDSLRQLLEALGNEDPTLLEALAVDRLFRDKTLLNLHRQEDRLQRRLSKLQTQLEALNKEAELRRSFEFHLAKRKREAEMATVQNELCGASREDSSYQPQQQSVSTATTASFGGASGSESRLRRL